MVRGKRVRNTPKERQSLIIVLDEVLLMTSSKRSRRHIYAD